MPNTFLQNSFMVAADPNGNIQAINVGKDDDGTPIYYELETQELEFGNCGHLKKIADQLTVVTQDGLDGQFQAREDDGDYKQIPIDLSENISIGKDIDLEGHYFTFRWFGEANKSSPTLEEIYIDQINDLGITDG
jgi:hypothetical protein